MPTHQGKTHTDILIGDGGENIALDSFIEFVATYGTTANFQYKRNNSAGADDEDSSYEIRVLDSTGTPLGTFFAEYTCEPVTGTATDVDSTRTNTFNPSPNGSNPAALPTSWQMFGSRTWIISSTKNSQTFAGFESRWKFAATTGSGVWVTYTVDTQTNDELEVTITYSNGSTVLSLVVTCHASATASAGVTLGSPSVTDSLQP